MDINKKHIPVGNAMGTPPQEYKKSFLNIYPIKEIVEIKKITKIKLFDRIVVVSFLFIFLPNNY